MGGEMQEVRFPIAAARGSAVVRVPTTEPGTVFAFALQLFKMARLSDTSAGLTVHFEDAALQAFWNAAVERGLEVHLELDGLEVSAGEVEVPWRGPYHVRTRDAVYLRCARGGLLESERAHLHVVLDDLVGPTRATEVLSAIPGLARISDEWGIWSEHGLNVTRLAALFTDDDHFYQALRGLANVGPRRIEALRDFAPKFVAWANQLAGP